MKADKKKFLLSLVTLRSLSLASCKETPSTPSTLPSTPSTSSSSTTTKEETKYSLSFDKSDKVKAEVNGLSEGKALPGEEVSFTLTSEEEEILSVTSQTAHLFNKEGTYFFTRPSHDVTIEVKSEAFGDPSILEVKDVDASSLPNNVASFKAYFEKARSVEGTYFKKGSLINDNFYGTVAYQDYEAVAGKNDVLILKGHQKSNVSDSYSTYYSSERGREDNIYYSLTSSSSLGSAPEVTDTYSFKTIIKDDSEAVGVDEIKESDAKLNYSSLGGAKSIYDRFFADNASFKLEDYKESLPSLSYCLKDITKSVSEDKKSASFDLKAYYTSWTGTDCVNLSFVFDGDSFLKEAKLTKVSYGDGEYDETTKLPLDGAKGTVKGTYQIKRERGYKPTLNKRDISSFAMDDYDISLSYSLSGESKEADRSNAIVENGSTLSFAFLPKDNKPTLILPHLKEVAEGEGYVDRKTLTVRKEGEFTLVFDNGFGKEKKIKVTSVEPKPSSLSANIPGHIYLNGTASLTVSLLPEKADQEVTISKNDDSVGEAEFSLNQDGTYTVKGTKLGKASYTVASKKYSEVKESISFEVIEKPDASKFKNNVLSKTFYGEGGGYKGVVNFNEDGSGKYKTATTGRYGAYESEASFTWTFDETNLTFKISGAEGSYYTNRGFTSFSAISENLAEGSFVNYDYYGTATSFTLERTGQERKDLSNFD